MRNSELLTNQAQAKALLAFSNLAFNGSPLALVIDELLLPCGHHLNHAQP